MPRRAPGQGQAARPRRSDLVAERSIYFYRARVDGNGHGNPPGLDPRPLLRQIGTLPYDENGRYWQQDDGNVVYCEPDRNTYPCRLRIITSRRVGLPQVERVGRLTALNIALEAGLAETTHVVHFEDGIVGAEFNFYGPRVSRLPTYYLLKCGLPQISFDALISNDMATALGELRDIRLFSIQVRASYIETIKDADRSLGDALDAAARVGGAKEVQITLKPEPYSRVPLSDRLLAVTRSLLGQRDRLREEASHFWVKGFNGEKQKVAWLDLLSDHLVAQKEIIRADGRSRVLNRGSAYDAIESAYRDLLPRLRSAAGIS